MLHKEMDLYIYMSVTHEFVTGIYMHEFMVEIDMLSVYAMYRNDCIEWVLA